MTAKTYRRAPVRVRVSKKSQASRALAWLRRKSAHVVLAGSGAGGMPCSLEDLPHCGGGDLDPQGRELAMDAPIPPRGVLTGEAQDQGADRADGGRASTPSWYAGRGVLPFEQVAVPAQDRVGAYQEKELVQLVDREVVEQAGEDGAVGLGEGRSADMALQNHELVSERKELDVLIAVAHRQQAKEGEGVGRGEVGQAQQHDRS
jgi:hypothetical protein